MSCLFRRVVYFVVLSLTFSFYNLSVHSSVISQERRQSSQNSEACPSVLEKIEVPQAFERAGTTNYVSPIPEFLQPFFRYYRYPVLVDGSIKNIKLEIDPPQTNLVSYTTVLERLLKVLSDLPRSILKEVKQIWIVSENRRNTFRAATAYAKRGPGSGVIIIYPISGIYKGVSEYNHDRLLFLMRHELGHIIASVKYGYANGEHNVPSRWQDAILADGENVSEHVNMDIQEDFAEAMRLYLTFNGGIDNPLVAVKYRHRFEILDEIMGVDAAYREKVNRRGYIMSSIFNDSNDVVSRSLIEL